MKTIQYKPKITNLPFFFICLFFILLFPLTITSARKGVGKEIGVWNIKNGQLERTSHDISFAEKYWNSIYSILPEELLKEYVVSLRLFTDGLDNDLGGMNQMDQSNKKWQMDIDISDMNLDNQDSAHIIDYTHTMIHEFGHLLTLNSSQVEPTEDIYEDETKGYLTYEGYALKTSYLYQFVNQFWAPPVLAEWRKIDKKRGKRKLKLLYEFYLANQDNFVTDYAAESPEEDIAESWTFFILSDKPEADKIKKQKMLFFYQFPELVQYRTEIRSRIENIPAQYLEYYSSQYQ
ncbi:MAG: putative zinc-binding metallopeptidase [Spirochaetes bacterium]|nr:putative zinc-binding metallopeptidase [Spirochaetota bacterium]